MSSTPLWACSISGVSVSSVAIRLEYLVVHLLGGAFERFTRFLFAEHCSFEQRVDAVEDGVTFRAERNWV
jgi:hypothetical protein